MQAANACTVCQYEWVVQKRSERCLSWFAHRAAGLCRPLPSRCLPGTLQAAADHTRLECINKRALHACRPQAAMQRMHCTHAPGGHTAPATAFGAQQAARTHTRGIGAGRHTCNAAEMQVVRQQAQHNSGVTSGAHKWVADSI
jgi:hypothetical protein